MKHKAQRLDTEEWITGGLLIYDDKQYLVPPRYSSRPIEDFQIKPETLQIKCSDGEWRKVDEVEIVFKKKFEKCIGCIYIACENHKECLYGV